MKFETTKIPGVTVIEPVVHGDARGFFLEFYHAERYRENGIDAVFVQDNHSKSGRGILRGLHAQNPHAQGKLVRAIEGEIWDVVVDARLGSPTYGQHVGVSLSAENHRQIWVPPGLVHGFCVVSDSAQVEYKCTDVYHPEAEFSVAWDDPDLGIEWPIEEPLLSEKDRAAPRLAEVQERLLPFEG